MAPTDLGPRIVEALSRFSRYSLFDASVGLLGTLGYSSDRRITLQTNSAAEFCELFQTARPVDPQKALLADWLSVDFLFQLTDEEIGNHLSFSRGMVDNSIIESYVFLAIHLKEPQYSRTRLATATREINRIFSMPAMILFLHGDTLSLSVIDRELNKLDPTRDVLRKVTLIKDIRFAEPVRAQVDILADLSLASLYGAFKFRNFVELHRALAKKLDSSELNKRFYKDIAHWYFWARKHPDVRLPKDVDAGSDEARSIFFIRLLTRLIFCWFLQEKRLIPRQLFRWSNVRELLKTTGPKAGTWYQAVLQNLFFATLNREPEKRGFREKSLTSRFDKGRGVTTLYRYEALLADPQGLLKLFEEVPFVNGGLFDCLDEVYKKAENRPNIRRDGFSDNPRESVHLPNELFFGKDQHADFTEEYNDLRKVDIPVHPLMETLERYKFTVQENTPFEQEIALDPELLGKVFENLLASYNDETSSVARNKLGAFYTPRDVVDYMVDEALVATLGTSVPEPMVRNLLSDLASNPCSDSETETLIAAIEKIRILDPACGSGAFPMGALHRLVHLLSKLDPNNIRWKRRLLDAATRDREKAEAMEDLENRAGALDKVNSRIADIESSFDSAHHELDYARKLYLIENSIFGVDIQPIACQIAKLRFFIALLVDQKSEKGIRPLPNLETRIVAANTLIPVQKPEEKGEQFVFETEEVKRLRKGLRLVRHDHFNARSPEQKLVFRARDAAIRQDLSLVLQQQMSRDSAVKLAEWDPYDQNKHAEFFDPEWMFSLDGEEFTGFDIVLGNPPYVRQEKIKSLKPLLKQYYECYTSAADLFVYFYERGIGLLRTGGVFSFITSNKWLRSGYGGLLRSWLKKETQVRRLIDFGDAEIFDAIAYPCIIVLRKGRAESATTIAALNWDMSWKVEDVRKHLTEDTFEMVQTDLAPQAWRIEGRTKIALLDRISAAGTPLGEYVKGRFYRGILTGLNDVFVVPRATRDELIEEDTASAQLLKPFLRGRDIKRWQVEFADQYLIRIESSENVGHAWSGKGDSQAEKVFAQTHPAIHALMKPYRKDLIARSDHGKYYWELRSCSYWDAFEKPKIIVPAISGTVNFAADRKGYYSNNKSTIFIPDSVAYACAIANSQISDWYARQTFATKQGGFFDFEPRYSTQLTIPSATPAQQGLVERIAEYVIQLKGQGPAAAYFERLLNGLVYELFFERELHAEKLTIFAHLTAAKPPKPTAKTDLAAFHQQIAEVSHPIYADLFSLNGLEVVQVIEESEITPNEDHED